MLSNCLGLQALELLEREKMKKVEKEQKEREEKEEKEERKVEEPLGKVEVSGKVEWMKINQQTRSWR